MAASLSTDTRGKLTRKYRRFVGGEMPVLTLTYPRQNPLQAARRLRAHLPIPIIHAHFYNPSDVPPIGMYSATYLLMV